MRHIKAISAQLMIVLIVLFSFYGCSNVVESEPVVSTEGDMLKTIDSMPAEELSSDEENGLTFMREEEKLARDVYITLYQTWNYQVFDNISKSEQQHTDALKTLLDKYGLEDPMETDEFGVFQNEDLQNLYNSLIETGKKSLVDALQVGAAIEEIDILDLEKYEGQIDNEDIIFVYDNLMKGSRNHLRAYVQSLESEGVTYTAQYMSEEDFLAIINSDMERGNTNGQGHRGQGNNGNGNNGNSGSGNSGNGNGNGHGHGFGRGN